MDYSRFDKPIDGKLRSRVTTIEDMVHAHDDSIDGRAHIKDLKQIRDDLELDRAPSTGAKALGMMDKGAMRLAGSIPIEVWRADAELNPNCHHEERAKRLLHKFPQFAFGRM